MVDLSALNKFYRTSDADVVAADIASGKIAYRVFKNETGFLFGLQDQPGNELPVMNG